jgi:uncharacterized membrane protein YkoI
MAINIFNFVYGITMKFALSLILLFLFTLSVDAIAQGGFVSGASSSKHKKQDNAEFRVKSSKQAAKAAKGRFGGKVLKVQKQKSGYRVKLIKTNGQIVSVYVDAKTGRIKGG